MAQVPREAVEFTRMVVRAFYPPEFIVVTDAVLRYNNYCAHHDLSRRLKFQPKELRQILTRMVHARLMCNEKRQQKRINLHDERRPTRTVNTEFWYVPLPEVIDAFMFRVHKMTKECDERRSNELARQKYVCPRCKSEYALLEILSEMTPQGDFICTKMGVRADRRPRPCAGIIKEQDNKAQIHETERVMQKLSEELRPLRAKADQCSNMDIPAHPLDGADEKTWGEIVPETVGIHGEAVDEEGLNKELSAKLNRKDGTKPHPMPEIDRPIIVEPKVNVPVPDQPLWFNVSNKDADDADDDWVDEQGGQNHLDSKTGTAASFFAEQDEKEYYERYLKEIGKESGGSSAKESPSPETDAAKPAPEKSSPKNTKPVAEDLPAPSSAPAAEDDPEDAIVFVSGNKMKLSEVSEEMTEKMTAEEYKAYYALAQAGGRGDGEDDDDDFE